MHMTLISVKILFDNSLHYLQLDAAPGHLTATIRRIIAESGRIAILTPGGTSGYVQPCDSLVNASLQGSLMKVRGSGERQDRLKMKLSNFYVDKNFNHKCTLHSQANTHFNYIPICS